MYSTKYRITFFVAFLVLAYSTLFHHIGKQPIKIWDESLFSLRALYMSENNAYMPNFNVYEGLDNHRNTKLPFTTIIQAASFKAFGLNEKALRIPIGIIFFLTLLSTVYFARKYLEDEMYAYVFSVIILTCFGFMRDHMGRFGDHDVPFACYNFLSLLFFYLYIKKEHIKYLVLFTICMIASLLTKNFLALLFLPGLAVYSMYKRKFFQYISSPAIYTAIFFLVASFTMTIVILEDAYSGYFYRMWDYELFGRYTSNIEGHKGGFFHFFEVWFSDFFEPWYAFIWTIPFIFLSKASSKENKDFSVLMLIAFLSYFLVISLSATKTYWYYAPIFFILAFLTANGNVNFYHWIQEKTKQNVISKYALIVIFFATSSFAIYNILHRVTYLPETQVKDEQYVHFLRQLEKTKPDLKEFSLCDNNFGTVAYFYAHSYNAEKGYNIRFRRGGKYEEGEKVMACLNNVMAPIKKRYHVTTLDSFKYCRILEIGKPTGKW